MARRTARDDSLVDGLRVMTLDIQACQEARADSRRVSVGTVDVGGDSDGDGVQFGGDGLTPGGHLAAV